MHTEKFPNVHFIIHTRVTEQNGMWPIKSIHNVEEEI